jgi:hypothetical protein
MVNPRDIDRRTGTTYGNGSNGVANQTGNIGGATGTNSGFGAIFAPSDPTNYDLPPGAPPGGNPNGPGGGGYGSGGGGGGGPAPAGIDQTTYDRYFAGGYTPQQYEYQDVNTPDYVGQPFRPWDPTQYDTLREGVTTGVGQARDAAGNALDNSAKAYGAAENPFTNRNFAKSGGIDPRLQQSMNAYGGQGAADEQQFMANQGDLGMGATYDMLSKSTDAYNQNMVNSVEGDRAQMIERMSMAETSMLLGVDVAMQKAKAQYDKDKFEYGEEIARQNWEKNRDEALANSQGQNQANQANTMSNNTYNQQQNDNWLQLMMQGINGAGAQTLDLSQGPNYVNG